MPLSLLPGGPPMPLVEGTLLHAGAGLVVEKKVVFPPASAVVKEAMVPHWLSM